MHLYKLLEHITWPHNKEKDYIINGQAIGMLKDAVWRIVTDSIGKTQNWRLFSNGETFIAYQENPEQLKYTPGGRYQEITGEPIKKIKKNFIIASARFIGTDSMGYVQGEFSQLKIFSTHITKGDGTGYCPYSLKGFIANWDQIEVQED